MKFFNLFLCVNLILTQTLSFTPSVSYAKTLEENAKNSSEQLIYLIEAAQKELGINGVKRELRVLADLGVNILPLRNYVLNANNGNPQKIVFEGHESEQSSIDYANAQLKEVGIDFYQYELKINNNLPNVNNPDSQSQANYKRWQVTRSILLPLMGLAAVGIEQALLEKSETPENPHDLRRGLLENVSVGFAILGLETFFSFTSKWWSDHAFSKDYAFNVKLPQFKMAMSRIKIQLNKVIDATNKLAEITINKPFKKLGFIHQAHVYSFLVNWAYTFIIYTVAHVGAYQVGLSYNDLQLSDKTLLDHFIHVVNSSFVGNTIFFMNFGLWQIYIGVRKKQGQLSESLRLKLETIPAYWSNFWRATSAFTGSPLLAYSALIGFGAVATLPIMIDSLRSKKNNEKLKQKFISNENLTTPTNICINLFAKPIGKPLFYRNQTLGGLAKTLLGKF